MDVLRAKAWVAECMRLSGSRSLYALRQFALGAQADDVRYFERIARGTYSPGSVLLRNVEKVIPGSMHVYLNGPQEGGRVVPLWAALSAPIDELWDILNWYSVAFERSRLFGYSQSHRVDYLVQRVTDGKLSLADLRQPRAMKDLQDHGMGMLDSPSGALPAEYQEIAQYQVDVYRAPVDDNLEDMVDSTVRHPFVKLMVEGAVKPNLGALAASVALWRLSHFLGEYWCEMDDFLRGLLLAPRRRVQLDAQGAVVGTIPDSRAGSYASVVLGPLQIEQDFMRMIRSSWTKNAQKYAAVVHTFAGERSRLKLPASPPEIDP